MKRAGLSLREIAERLNYNSIAAVSESITAEMEKEVAAMHRADRDQILAMEVDRLDYVQSVIWQQVSLGDLKAIESFLKIQAQRIKLLQLDAVDTSTQTTQVLIVGDSEADYIARLRELSD